MLAAGTAIPWPAFDLGTCRRNDDNMQNELAWSRKPAGLSGRIVGATGASEAKGTAAIRTPSDETAGTVICAARFAKGWHGYRLSMDPHPHQAEANEADPEKQSSPAGFAPDLERTAEEMGA